MAPFCLAPGTRYLADAAAPALHGVLLVVLLLVLLDLLREEGVEDEVHQLGGGGLGGALVLVYFGGVPDGLPPDGSPAGKVRAVSPTPRTTESPATRSAPTGQRDSLWDRFGKISAPISRCYESTRAKSLKFSQLGTSTGFTS